MKSVGAASCREFWTSRRANTRQDAASTGRSSLQSSLLIREVE